MKNKNVAFMTQAAMIAAIYVVLTYVFAPFSFGEVQIILQKHLRSFRYLHRQRFLDFLLDVLLETFSEEQSCRISFSEALQL